jgi:hypothetical protein
MDIRVKTFSLIRRYGAGLVALGFLFSMSAASAGEGKVCKVLPEFLDQKGRRSLDPSLYERDAYQFYLRRHPSQISGLGVEVQWKAHGADWTKTKLRAELRGLLTNSTQTVTLEMPVKKSGLFSKWTQFSITGDQFKKFGELVAWRVTLWEGDRQLSEQESFLWSGVPVAAQAP